MQAPMLVVLKVEFDVSEKKIKSATNNTVMTERYVYLNFLFRALQSLAMRATFDLHSSTALSNSPVTRRAGLSCLKDAL